MTLSARGTLLFIMAGLAGCQTLESAGDRMSCSSSFCVREYAHTDVTQTPEKYDSLLVLPPQYALAHRAVDGSEQTSTSQPAEIPESLYQAMEGPAASYQFSLSPLTIQSNEEKKAVAAFHEALWQPAGNPTSLIQETPLFGVPEMSDPVAIETLPIPEPVTARADGYCCLLVTRITGWTDTPGARSAKVATAAILSVLPGASGVAADGGDVLTDIAVVRIDDGTVVWSSQTLGTGRASEIRRSIQPFFSSVYNAKYAP